MKPLSLLAGLCLGLASWLMLPCPSAQAQALVEFGTFNGWGHTTSPTFIVDANGDPLAESLMGTNFWFLCLDEEADPPFYGIPTQHEYALSTDSSILTAGAWGLITNTSHRAAILDGVANMFYNNYVAILADPTTSGNDYDASAGLAMQTAAWTMITSYTNSLWTGVLDEVAVDAILTGYAEYQGTQVETFLRSSLITHAISNPGIVYANPAGSTPGNYQAAMLFSLPVPEPGSALLVGLGFVSLALRRRRAA